MQSSARVKMYQKRYVFVGVTDVEVEVGGKKPPRLMRKRGNSFGKKEKRIDDPFPTLYFLG